MPDTIRGDASTFATLSANARSTSAIDFAGDSDWWRINLVAGTSYLFDLTGSSADGYGVGLTLDDPLLVLRDAAGAPVATDDDSGPAQDSRILFTPTQGGTYFLDAGGYADSTGSYAIIVNANPVVGPLTVGTATTGAIGRNGNINLFTVNLTAGSGYLFTLDGTTLSDPFLELMDATAAVIALDDDSGPGNNAMLSYVPDTSGQYYVVARSSGNIGTGQYQLRAVSLPVLSITGATVTEGNSGSTPATFTLTLSQSSATPVTVTVSTAPDTAQPGSDYTDQTTTVTFAPGQTQAAFSVSVIGDAMLEPDEHFFAQLADPVGAVLAGTGAASATITNDDSAAYAVPLDEGLRLQWHLYGPPGVSAMATWASYSGRGVKVGIFDQGVDATNPDLQANVLTQLGRRALDLAPGGNPVLADDDHGTAVAGVIAAAANGTGEVGVAPDASIVSIYSDLSSTDTLPGEIANAFNYARSTVDVLNDSWGYGNLFFSGTNYAFFDDFAAPAFTAAGQALKSLADLGRNGLGTVVVQSAGNAFGYGDDTNLHNLQNSRYIITVGGTTAGAQSAWFSSPGASILVSAPSGDGSGSFGDILTTDRTGAAGFDSGDSTFIAGTSFSAPIVSGIVALMLQANPGLGYRDVQEILADSTRRIDTTNNDWAYNAASNWNGGGRHYDSLTHDLGFGLVDALAAVRLAETWSPVAHTSANAQLLTLSAAPHLQIPDNGDQTGAGGAISSVFVGTDLSVERVEVTLNVTHPYIGDLYVVLTSPAHTESYLLSRPGSGALSAFGSSQADIHFTFDTVLDWGESALGTWQLDVVDAQAFDVGTFDSWSLTLIGKPASPDDTYVYTDEYADALSDQPQRGTLIDSGGNDTLNAAAVTSDLSIDLTPGASSTIAGRTLLMGPTTMIENAYGGDGNDMLRGNAQDNTLSGMRGNDTLDGGAGLDTALFSGTRASHNLAPASGGYTVADTVAGRDGTDTVMNMEVLHFSDMSVDLGARARSLTISAADLKTLEELYVGFFNRVPESSGLGYWIDQHAAGLSLAGVANQFYGAGVQFGLYPAMMTNAQFVQAVYANVLFRPPGSPNAPNEGEIGYWVAYFTDPAHPEQTKGTMVLQMLHDVHAFFETDPVYGFVASSLNNKAAVANDYAISQGLSFNVQADNIPFGIQLASLITPTDTSAAIAFIGVNDFSMT